MKLLFPHFIVALFVTLTQSGFSQVAITGTMTDSKGEPLPQGNVRLLTVTKALVTGAITDFDGQYTITASPDSSYLLLYSYVGYLSVYKNIKVGKTNVVLETITLKEDPKYLQEVEVKVLQTRGEQKGDTTAFNADAFKTNPDATSEDLLKKLPGVTSDGNGVKVNGETVTKILVDGKPFFGDDPAAALKNLPADIIDKVEIFDKESDQAAFTGFSDGEQQKTINLVTKKGKNQGQFGRIYGGAGGDEDQNLRYNAGAAVNSFKDKQKVTLLLLSNNVNQQNFSTSDISGAMGSSGGSGRSGGGGRRSDNSLLAANQNGITTTQSAGLNYTDQWGKKAEVSGSYFFNNTNNIASTRITRNYFTENNLVYKQNNDDQVTNQNHRINLRIEFEPDSANKIILVPSLNIQNNNARSNLFGENIIGDNIRLSNTNTRSGIINKAYDFNNFLLVQHKFSKPGRTISARINTTINDRNNNGNYYSMNNYSDTASTILDQHFGTVNVTRKIGGSLSYTEPLNKLSQLQINYSPSYTEANSNRQTMDYDAVATDYSDFNPSLSNKYENVYKTQKAGLGYRYRKEKLNLGIGVDMQESVLSGEQTFPTAFTLDQSFRNILPNARLNYKFSKTKNLRINYRSSTDIPNITQLQNVVDISNPLQVKSGNPSLKQTFDNSLNFRLGGFNPTTSKNTMLFLSANYTDNYISNATYILRSDSLIQNYVVKAGSQLTKPVNLDNFYSARAFFVYGFPTTFLKSNMNFNGGLNFNHAPTLFNEILNYSNSYAGNIGFYIGSNISEKIDFSLSYNANYTVVKNTVQKKSDNNFFSQSTGAKINWIFGERFVVNTELNHTLYNGLSQDFNQDFFLWNAYVGYKFLKNKALEARISMYDILNENRSISRTVTGAYTEDNFTTVLRRYALFTLTYTFKNFKGNSKPEEIPAEGDGPPKGRRGE